MPLSSDLMGRIIAADLLPDLIAARFHRLIVVGAGGLNTLLVIQDANALLVGELLVLFILFQHIQYALAGFNLVRIPFRRINTGAIGIFQFGVFFRRLSDVVQATRPAAIMAISSIFFIVVLPEVRQAHARRAGIRK